MSDLKALFDQFNQTFQKDIKSILSWKDLKFNGDPSLTKPQELDENN
jgi:hypothetical protein